MSALSLFQQSIIGLIIVILFPFWLYKMIKIASIAWHDGKDYINKKIIREILNGKKD